MNDIIKYQEYPNINREYKSTLFVMAFEDKKDLLSLFNAVNGIDYDEPECLEITTLENAIYLNYKNDVSYSTALQKLPTPRYVVFYNGTKEQPDRSIMRLSDAYSYFIFKVREFLNSGLAQEEAINCAIDKCIDENRLKDILINQRSEVLGVLLSTYNKELYEQG